MLPQFLDENRLLLNKVLRRVVWYYGVVSFNHSYKRFNVYLTRGANPGRMRMFHPSPKNLTAFPQ